MFDTFARTGGAVTSRTEGTGLGMAIAKKLVELMGGTIRCESELGHGTTFTVLMHMKYAEDSEAVPLNIASGRPHGDYGASENDALDLTGKRILLVEDNAMNREIAKQIISETGAAVEEANNGREAVDAFSRNPADYYDLIFMDIQMPVMNGYEATAAIRSMERRTSRVCPYML